MRHSRNTDPDKIRLITIQTLRAELLLRPDKELNEIVGGVIAKYQEELDIRLFAHKTLSNHYHMLAQAPKQNLWRFCQAVNRELAKRVNKHLNRSGPLWGRRYDEQITVEEVDALEALIYILCNATNHGFRIGSLYGASEPLDSV